MLIAPGLLQDILRPLRRDVSSHECQELADLASHWTKFTTQMVTDQYNNFAGFYAANNNFGNTLILFRTFIMDDTACTTHFRLPLFTVIGIDEHGRNQVLGFAILMRQTTL
jgi:hypothetical protein